MTVIDIEWGTLKQKKPICYKQMDKMIPLAEKCKTCLYKLDCMIFTAKAKGWL
jgi:hypothetical protein